MVEFNSGDDAWYFSADDGEGGFSLDHLNLYVDKNLTESQIENGYYKCMAYNSKQEAINAMMERLNYILWLLDSNVES